MSIVSPSTHRPAGSFLARAVPYLALAGSILSYCVGSSFAKQLFPMIGASGTACYRVGFSALILLAVFRPWRGALTRSDMFAIIRYGVALGLMNLGFYLSIRTIPLGIAIAIEFLGPLSVSLIHSHRPHHFMAVGLAVAGLALLLPLNLSHHAALDPAGVGYALFAGLCWGLYIVFGKKTGHLPGGQAVALGMVVAALFIVPIGVIADGPALLTPSLSLCAIGFVTAVLSSCIPYSLDMVAFRRIPSSRIGVLISVEPAAAAMAGWLMLGERLFPLQWLAIGLVVAASVASVIVTDKSDVPV